MKKTNTNQNVSSDNRKIQLKGIDAYLGYMLRFVSNQVTNAFQQQLAKKHVTVAEWLVLRFLWDYAPCSSKQLSEAMGIDKGAISRLSDRLEKRNMIKRTADLKDRRLYSIELTPAGSKLVPQLAMIADQNDANFFDHLTKKQFAEIMEFLIDMVNRYEFTRKPID